MNDIDVITPETEDKTQTKFSSRLYKFFIRANSAITEIGARRQAELLAALSLVLFIGTAIGFLFASNPFTLGVLASVSFLVYLISRTKWYLVGAFFLTTGFTLSPLQSIMSGTSPDVGISFFTTIPITMALSLALLPSWGLNIIGILNFLTLVGVPIYAPNAAIQELTPTAGSLSVFIILVLITNRMRSVIERIRLREVNEINLELEEARGNLEERVEQRTAELVSANQETATRVEQLQTVGEVTRATLSIHEIDEVLPAITSLISERFGHYHVGIFLLDENNEYAILEAANSEGGQKMLKRKHQLKIGSEGIVGFVISRGQARIALDVGSDAVYFDNPDLPETRSEMALPLQVDMRTIGALDIQSTEPNMFDADDLPIFSTLANQVSIAIQNARLFEQAQSALKDAERLTRRLSGEAWSNVRQVHQTLGYRFDGKKSQALDNDARGQDKSKTTISIPVNLRGESIGTLKLISANPSRKWSEGELTIANTVVERVALALENTRLLEEAERRAAKERTISEGTSRVSKALDVESILQATAEELERALGSSEIVIQLTNEDGSGGPK